MADFLSRPRFTRLAIRRSKTGCIGAATRSESAVNVVPSADAHFLQTVRELRGGEFVAGGHGGLQFVAAAHGDDLLQRVRGGGLQLLQRQRRDAARARLKTACAPNRRDR